MITWRGATRRDEPIYRALGLSVGVIVHDLSDAERRAAYGATLRTARTTNSEFDYLPTT